MGVLWKQLLTPEVLTRGWHLARLDTRQDFSEDLYSTDVYGQDLRNLINETLKRIKTGTYQANPLFRMEVPKGSLAFRPGTVIPIHDRVVVSAIVLLLAPEIDKHLPDAVFSWRLKDPLPKTGPIFRETDITDLPFLKKKTIRVEVDPFEGWYRLWPQFDEVTRRLYQIEGYRYLATSDIAAYFENIQLPILRDQLLTFLPKEAELVNLLFHFLEAWAERTTDGRVHFRGIPQGNFVSSFLGNIFLLPLDQALLGIVKDGEIAYFRYMDDVRIFTKQREDARRALFLMARKLRELHLNVQTAKTKIYDESQGEISNLLIDPRVDRLSDLIGEIQTKHRGKAPPYKERRAIEAQLKVIAKADSPSGQKIIGARSALDGLTLRCFSRWVTAHLMIESDEYLGRLLAEISKSADYKLTRKLIASAKKFPKRRGIESEFLRLLSSGKIIFPYQEAECLRAVRYLSNVSLDTQDHAWRRLVDANQDRYLRMQAAYLLARTDLGRRKLRQLEKKFDDEPDSYVQAAMALLLVQRRENNQDIVRKLVFHPNSKVREIGKYFRTIKNDIEQAREALRHAFRPEIPWVLCDFVPLVHLMASSANQDIRSLLVDTLRDPRRNHPIGGLREILASIFTRTRESLKESSA
ncbi:MAG: hypothetical protein H6983_19720 [Ectothiorhodospiraceae bacterium]|nr:hypothetical protein [Ectothiorhodospiraceae bacterium]